MTVKGIVKNGVVVLEGHAKLPEGLEVEVNTQPQAGLSAEVMRFAGTMPGPEDFALNHDHYIHGKPEQ